METKETNVMNVMSKLQKCRAELGNTKLKKTGKNPFARFDYFQLEDFMPTVNALFDKYGLFSQFNICAESAELVIYNTAKTDEVVKFTSPIADASVKGCSAIQAIGSANTYMRRYLYMNALEISEGDALDAAVGDDKHPPVEFKPTKPVPVKVEPEKQVVQLATPEQVKILTEMIKVGEVDENAILTYCHCMTLDEVPMNVASATIQKHSKEKEQNND